MHWHFCTPSSTLKRKNLKYWSVFKECFLSFYIIYILLHTKKPSIATLMISLNCIHCIIFSFLLIWFCKLYSSIQTHALSLPFFQLQSVLNSSQNFYSFYLPTKAYQKKTRTLYQQYNYRQRGQTSPYLNKLYKNRS